MVAAREQWIEQGIECELIAVGESVGEFATTLEACGYRIHQLKPSRFSLLFGFFLLLLKRRPDVVHIHTERASFWLALESRLLGRRVVQTIHNVFSFSGSLQRERKIQRRISRNLGVTFVAVGTSVAHNEQVQFDNNAQVIWNWVDLEKFSPPTRQQQDQARQALGLTDDDFAVISVGNCWPEKNHSVIIEAMALETTPPHVVYLHVGDDSVGEGMQEHLLAENQSLTNRIRFLGTRSDVPQLLHAANLFLMPSAYEGLPIAAIEALATNLPVLLGDSPGLRDLHALADAICLAKVDAPSFSSSIAEILLNSPIETPNFQSREIAELWFDPARGVARYAEVYRNQPQGGPR